MYINEARIEESVAVHAETGRRSIDEHLQFFVRLAIRFGAANWVSRVCIVGGIAYGSRNGAPIEALNAGTTWRRATGWIPFATGDDFWCIH